jgi:hypothetical protein
MSYLFVCAVVAETLRESVHGIDDVRKAGLLIGQLSSAGGNHG